MAITAFTAVSIPYRCFSKSFSHRAQRATCASGLGVRAGRTPAGDLPSPASITATPGDNAGVMNLDWQIVAKARGYSIQYADASTTERNWMPLTTSNKAHCTVSGLTSGATLAFRVATNGGASGQSEWSYEIVRVVP